MTPALPGLKYSLKGLGEGVRVTYEGALSPLSQNFYPRTRQCGGSTRIFMMGRKMG